MTVESGESKSAGSAAPQSPPEPEPARPHSRPSGKSRRHFLHRRRDGEPSWPQHPAISAAVLTFCGGLVLLRVYLMAVHGGGRSVPAYAEVLMQLQMIAVLGAAMYWLLRRSEGDFRALLGVSLVLFACGEGLNTLARNYGLLPLLRLGSVFNIALFLYSSLTITAAIADLPRARFAQNRPGNAHAALVVSSFGLMLFSTLRLFLQISRRDLDDAANHVATLVLAGIVLFVTVLLRRRV